MSRNTIDSACRQLVGRLCEELDTARSLRVFLSLGGVKPVQDGEVLDYCASSPVCFAEDYLLEKLLSKYKGWPGDGPKAASRKAIDTWFSVEAKNKETNRRLRGLMDSSGFPGTYLIDVISDAAATISSILGSFDIFRVLEGSKWGPGATSDLRRGTLRDQKMTRRMSTTAAALPYMKAIIEANPNWIEAITGFYPSGPTSLTRDFFKVTNSSRFSTVPKKWDVDRVIEIQPTANTYLQLGVGQYLRKRLLRFGIDLNSQEHNQIAALLGVQDDLATVDLQNASDSISVELCTLLLPPDWLVFLRKLRTDTTVVEGQTRKLEKFSAMGNGFTFELETIVFYAITKAVCKVEKLSWDRVLVYGDDIICPTRAYEGLVYVCEYLGFTINLEKSFSAGVFRESCGKHYFRGVDVTPIYQKELINSPEEVIRFHNRLVRWCDRVYADPWRFPSVISMCHAFFLDMVKVEHRRVRLPRIPLGDVSDDGFLVPADEFQLDENSGVFTDVWVRSKQIRKHENEAAMFALRLSSFGRPNGNFFLWKKLFEGSGFFNSGSKGHSEEDLGKGRYRPRKRYIYDVKRYIDN
jgi:hypothetical protein